MAINPSDIASIGSAGGNPIEAMATGYKLADLVDQQAMNKMKMAGAQQEMQDIQTLKSLSSKYDVSTPEGQAKYASEAIKVNPEMGLKVQKAFNESQAGQNELTKSNYEVLSKQLELEANAVAPLWQQASTMQAQGRTPQEIDAALLPAATQTIQTLAKTTLPNGKPALSQEQITQLTGKLQNGNLKGLLDGIMLSHAKGYELLKSQQQKFGHPFAMTGPQGPGMYQQNPVTGAVSRLGGVAPTTAERNMEAGVTFGSIPAGGIDPGLVKSIGTYGRPPLSARERNTPAGQAVMAEVRKQYPEYKEYQYKVIGDAVNKFSTGKQGDTVRSIGVSMDHLATLEEAAKALNNGDVAALNRVGNFIQQQFGLSTAPNDFATIKPLVADEVLKAVVGGAGGVSDREELQKTISAASSPQALMSAISRLKELMGGQMLGLRRQYKAATGLDDFNDRILADQPEALQLLTEHETSVKARQQGAAPAGGAPKQITSDAEFNALPSGAVFLDPNGKQRRKP